MSSPKWGADARSSVTPRRTDPSYMGTESLWEPHTPVRPEPPPPLPPPLPPLIVRRKWYRRPLVVTGLALLVLCVGGGGLMFLASERLRDHATRGQNDLVRGGLHDTPH